MLKKLAIQNYALIKELDMAPHGGFTVITGETGAGKSIMLGALGLLLGNRADTTVMYDKESKCIVEGVFEVTAYHLENIFQENDLDFSNECVIRREITPGGKSRAFVNDTPTTLNVLKAIGSRLVDIHSQHETVLLGDEDFQLSVIDIYAGNHTKLESYRSKYTAFKQKENDLRNLQAEARELQNEFDYNNFLFEELNKLPLHELKLEEIEAELASLENAEEIKATVAGMEKNYDGGDFSVRQMLYEMNKSLERVSHLSTKFSEASRRFDSILIELNDIISEIGNLAGLIEYDPEKIEQLRNTVNELNRLQAKHQVSSLSDLIEIRDTLAAKVSNSVHVGSNLEKLEIGLKELESELKNVGEELRHARKKCFMPLKKELTNLLAGLGMPNATIEIQCREIAPSASGLDSIEILFSANKGVEPSSIKQVASGGEYSRLMLALKYLLASKTALPTIIFDEIDTGVSGEIALKMTRMLKSMSKNHQVISISHLPQFAASGDAHFYVYKDNTQERSLSKIKKLTGNERVEAIARMIGGDKPSNTAIQNARELLEAS